MHMRVHNAAPAINRNLPCDTTTFNKHNILKEELGLWYSLLGTCVPLIALQQPCLPGALLPHWHLCRTYC
jgi:hypothetical protein